MFAASLLLASGVSAFAQGNMQGDSDLYVPGELYVQFKPGVLNLPKSADRHVPVSALFPAAKSQSKYGLQDKAFSLRMGSDAVLANTFCIYMDSLSGFDDFIKELQADYGVKGFYGEKRVMLYGNGERETLGPYFGSDAEDEVVSFLLSLVLDSFDEIEEPVRL